MFVLFNKGKGFPYTISEKGEIVPTLNSNRSRLVLYGVILLFLKTLGLSFLICGGVGRTLEFHCFSLDHYGSHKCHKDVLGVSKGVRYLYVIRG